MKGIKMLFITVSLSLALVGCGMADGGKVTARDVLKQSDDADIIQYEGFIYNNVTNLEWFQDGEEVPFSKEYLQGEVKKQTKNSWLFNDLSATKLPKGTKVYSNTEEVKGFLFVEYEGEELYYMQLLEG
ncbi:MAG: hypothetical protein ACQEUT_19160 [Bacillota bacterium]